LDAEGTPPPDRSIGPASGRYRTKRRPQKPQQKAGGVGGVEGKRGVNAKLGGIRRKKLAAAQKMGAGGKKNCPTMEKGGPNGRRLNINLVKGKSVANHGGGRCVEPRREKGASQSEKAEGPHLYSNIRSQSGRNQKRNGRSTTHGIEGRVMNCGQKQKQGQHDARWCFW